MGEPVLRRKGSTDSNASWNPPDAPVPGSVAAKFYNTSENNGYSVCCQGSTSGYGSPNSNYNVLGNCVGFACGAYNELIASCRNNYNKMAYPYFNCNAANFIERANSYYPELKTSKIPALGSIIVWSGGWQNCGHVGFIYDIQELREQAEYRIHVSQSGYGTTNTLLGDFDALCCVENNWVPTPDKVSYSGYKYTYEGCIYPPEDVMAALGSPTFDPSLDIDEPTPDDPAPTIKSITDAFPKVIVDGKLNGNCKSARVYYKFNTTSVTEKTADGYVDVNSSLFAASITRPRNVNHIAILVKLLIDGKNICTSGHIKLSRIVPTVHLRYNGKTIKTVPYIYTSGRWRKVVPCIFTHKEWKKIYSKK